MIVDIEVVIILVGIAQKIIVIINGQIKLNLQK